MDEKYNQMAIEAMQQAKSAHHRIDEVEELMKEIRTDVKSTNQIAISVEKLATEMKAMREDAIDMNARLKQLEQKPGKNWENLIKTIITCIATAIAGYFLAKFGL